MEGFGRALIVFGVLLIVVGVVLSLGLKASGKLPWLGQLPGDIVVKRDNFTFYFPLTTCLLLSLTITPL